MYALIDLAKVKKVRSGKFYETLPDGRAIVPFSELRAFGTLENVGIVATALELKQLIEKQKEQGLTPGIPLEDTATQNGEKNPEDTQTDGTVTDGTTSEGTEPGGIGEEAIMPIDAEQKAKKGGKQ